MLTKRVAEKEGSAVGTADADADAGTASEAGTAAAREAASEASPRRVEHPRYAIHSMGGGDDDDDGDDDDGDEDASFCVRVSGASEAVCIQRIYIYIIPCLSTAAESNCSLTVHSPADHDHSCSL